MFFEKLWNEFAKLPEIEAIALGGSRSTEHFDDNSDYDLYLYCSSVPTPNRRTQILEKYCSYMEIGNCFWELEDDCTLKDGIDIDILYRNLENFEAEICSVVEKYQAHNGYTTCMWHNLLNSKLLYDRNGKYAAMKARFSVEYPEELKKNIIRKNMRLLTGNLPSYDTQIKKALSRKDFISVNHRTAAYMESYFDIIFAMNKLTHPGEKRMLQIAREKAKTLPDFFERNIECLYRDLFSNQEAVLCDIEKIYKCLLETPCIILED